MDQFFLWSRTLSQIEPNLEYPASSLHLPCSKQQWGNLLLLSDSLPPHPTGSLLSSLYHHFLISTINFSFCDVLFFGYPFCLYYFSISIISMGWISMCCSSVVACVALIVACLNPMTYKHCCLDKCAVMMAILLGENHVYHWI